MFPCIHCGNQLPDGATFCNQCWKTVSEDDVAAATSAAAPLDATAVSDLPAGPPPDAPAFEGPIGAPVSTAAPTSSDYPSAPPPAPPSPWDAPPPPAASPWTPAAPAAPGFPEAPAAASPWGQPSPPPAAAPGWGAPPPPPGSGAAGWPGGHQAPGYGAYPYAAPGYYAPPAPATNGMAIASLVCSLASFVVCGVSAPVGIILGHVALSQIKKTGAGGKGMAIAGLIVGYLITLLGALFIVLAIADSNNY